MGDPQYHWIQYDSILRMESNDWMIYGYPHDLGNLHLTILRDVPDTEHLIEVLSCDFLHAHLRMVLNVPRGAGFCLGWYQQ